MKIVILAGGFGTRITEESSIKPMVEIGGMPILWHIMKGLYIISTQSDGRLQWLIRGLKPKPADVLNE